uniref:Epidermal growth factor receptor substrate 15-like 1-like n=1 Tax=Saccoglossus kowalevskii TaxID=10224 RepID=A0ABM0MTN8_SACKO|nr:PREDICTED: epidermal growth factor receptor substrate 15-like 1-like [Saccoglossus kowalevskii]
MGTGRIGAIDAAAYLKKSGLKETVLHKIWELSDPAGKGFLDKQGFFVALKLIALSQNGEEASISNINLSVPPPNMYGGTGVSDPSHWSVTPQDKIKFDGIFDGLLPINGLLSGDKCKPVFMNSNLPVDILSKVWDLSDIDNDGYLDKDEFSVAMYLVYRALEKEVIPSTLPLSLIPLSKRKKPGPGLVGGVAVLPSVLPPAASLRRNTPTPPGSTGSVSPSTLSPQLGLKHAHLKTPATWVVSAQDKAHYDNIFKRLDTDNDGLVTGDEVRQTFLQYCIPQACLAHIWMLCDMKQIGRLNAEQFALALYLLSQKANNGVDPPLQLTGEMIPPSSRPKPLSDGTGSGNVSASSSMGDFSAIKELDSISKDIDQLGREKSQLLLDINQKESLSKQKEDEVQELLSELDKANTQLRQLEFQKTEAQKNLDELDESKAKLEATLAQVRDKCEEEEQNIKTLRSQISTQENTIKSQDDELNRLRIELNNLRQEESLLEQKVEAGKAQLDEVIKSLKESQSHVNEEQSKVNQLKETQRNLTNSIDRHNDILNKVSTGAITSIYDIDNALLDATTPTPSEIDSFSARATAGSSPVSSLSGFSTGSGFEKGDSDINADAFNGKDPFAMTLTETVDPFKDVDPFKTDIFTSDPFKDTDPFGAGKEDTVSDDPFKSTTAVDGQSYNAFTSTDLFSTDPFDSKCKASSIATDTFGGETFSTKDSMPALPPKKSKPASSDKVVDPFQSSNDDPFQFSNSDKDPFSGFSDKTVTPASDPFSSGSPSVQGSDPFSGSTTLAQTPDPFSSGVPGSDPFSGGTASVPASDPFSGGTAAVPSSDPFSGGTSSDPFGGGTASISSSDPFGDGAPSAPASDPFSGGIDPFSSTTSTQYEGFGGFAKTLEKLR